MAKKVNNKTNKAKSRNIKLIDNNIEKEPELLNKVIIALCVLCFLGLFYLLAIYITNKNDTSSSNDTTSSSSESYDYSNILFGSSLNRSESEYLVIYYDKSDDDISSEMSSAISTYKSKDEHLTVYTVDMSNSLNKVYTTSDESNRNPSSIDELRINGTTVIKVTEGKVTEYKEGTDSVKDYLG